jgi:colanic acid biosynthesis glycosyl transferase WcaI
MKRLIFLNRFFHPDHSATSQILSDLAFHMSAAGADVHVITSRQLYDSPRARLPRQEVVRGVKVHRVATTTFGRAALSGRALDYASYYGSMWRCARSHTRRGDILIAKTDPPLTSIFAVQVAATRHAHLLNWLQDIYPELAAGTGVPFMQGPVGQTLARLRNFSLTRAAANVVVGQRMAEHVQSLGAAPKRIHVIPNWTDDEQIRPLRHDENPLRTNWGLQEKFVIGYAGNLGRAHEFDTLLAAAELLRNDPRLVFLFVGGGHQFERLARAVKERGLNASFRFVPYQPQSLLKNSLNVADVHLVSLRPELEGLIVPSKFYGIAAAGRPVVSITATNGEIARIVREHECGIVIEPGNGQRLAEELMLLSQNPIRVAEMGGRARAMLEACFTRRQALARWQDLLTGLLKGDAPETELPVIAS